MELKLIEYGTAIVAELIADGEVISTASHGLDLVGNAYFQGAQGVVLYVHQLAPSFFDLKTGMAGEMLQKFSNYRMKLAIVGHFESTGNKAIHDFIRESNVVGHINFVSTREEGVERMLH